ncbi:MAG: hypothetical protein AAF310_00415 [Myxococcota bacterium]
MQVLSLYATWVLQHNIVAVKAVAKAYPQHLTVGNSKKGSAARGAKVNAVVWLVAFLHRVKAPAVSRIDACEPHGAFEKCLFERAAVFIEKALHFTILRSVGEAAVCAPLVDIFSRCNQAISQRAFA